MFYIFFIILLLFLITIFYFAKIRKESFVVIKEHIYSYDELNPLRCFVSGPESSVDMKYFNSVFKEYVYNFVSDENTKFKSDLAILPENIVLKEKDEKNSYPYDYLCNIGDISFSIVQNEDSEYINSFRGMAGKRLALLKGGYVEESWKDIIKTFNFKDPPIFVYYKNDRELINLFRQNKIDALASLTPHPNDTILLLSTIMKIRMIPWNESDQFNDMLMYKIKGLKKTKIDLRFYQSYIYSFSINYDSFGFSRALFVNKTLSDEIVHDLTNLTFLYQNIVRPAALLLSEYIPIHNGTLLWLKKRGFINTYSGPEDKACGLIAGKYECVGEKKDLARRFYDRDLTNILNNETKPMNALRHLKNAQKNQNSSLFSGYYKLQLENSYKCSNFPLIRSKEECDKVSSVWDRPCINDNECPFYKANQNYPNNFGGCKDGFCEMPLNVTRVGFKKYISKPICHDESNINPTQCRIIGSMVSPDYAFKNDRKERMKNTEELGQRGINV